MKLLINKKEMHFISVSWKGSKYGAARSLSIVLPSSPKDVNVPKYTISAGDSVIYIDELGNEIFRGVVFYKEKSFHGNTISITAYDYLIYLLKSKTAYNLKTTTPSQMLKKISNESGISVGTIADAYITVKTDVYIDYSYYDIIMDVYKKVSAITKEKYFLSINRGKLNALNAGKEIKNFSLENYKNISDSTYTETIENVINRVIAVDDKGKRIGVYNGSNQNKWGIFQCVYQKEEKKNVEIEAKKLFHGADLQATISAMGDTRCISGYGVRIKEPYTGLIGLFYIEEDEHNWENGVYTMNLTLNFKNIMDGAS
ncbi:hypothetical protein J5Y03_10055 [Bacillus sp. RG28]|uniref:YqbQ/XkdQ domain-containing protein n=1 Tax=Gottfriedia endophytica TaxID=2820819 RepID=A0A940NJG4_9BACI|nr:hypothetical protein [Gottfriedia endophytica]MBP0725530.1 hypothetical protein [Gottfriedia endophytica]